MKDDLTLCAEVFLKEQTKLYDEPVAQDIEEAKEFLEELAEELEVFALPDGRFFVVEG